MTDVRLDPAPTGLTRPPRDARRFRRYAGAALLPVPALAIAASLGITPTYAIEDTASAIEAAAADPAAAAASNWLGLVAVLTLVPAFLVAVRLARRRRPVLAVVTASINTVAYLSTAVIASDVALEVAGRDEFDPPSMAPFLEAVFTHPTAGVGVGLFVIGHIVGAVLLGVLLRGIIPTWACVALAVSQPLHFVAFVILQNRYVDVAAWGLTAVGLAVCAVAVLRTPDDEWDLAPIAR